MHWLDTIILGIVGFAAIWGAFTGFLWQVSRILTVVLAVYCTIMFNNAAAPLVQRFLMPKAPEFASQLGAYVLVFLTVCLVMFLFTILLHRVIQKVQLQWVNRTLGAFFGAGQSALIAGAILLLASSYDSAAEIIQESQIARPMVAGMSRMTTLLPGEAQPPADANAQPPAAQQAEQKAAPTGNSRVERIQRQLDEIMKRVKSK